jgi:hydrogenase nickel incorporation protein HypA/HybF
MHELSIMESVLEIVRNNARQNSIGKVNKLKLVIGQSTMVMTDSLQFAFEVLSQEDLFRGSILEIETKETIIHCKDCEKEFTQELGYCFLCPDCGSDKIDIVQGRELYLDYYEGDSNNGPS